MKKLISLLLVICMLCPLFVGCANQDKDYKMKKNYIRQFKIKDKEPEDVIIDYDGGTYSGARIVMLDTEWHDPEKWTETIGDTTIQYYDSNRLYAYKNGKFYTLSDAYEKGKLSKNEITQIALKFSMDVCFYLDTCDIYDFDKSSFVDGDLSKNEMYDKLNVWVDWKALEGIDFTSTTWVEHMTTHLGNNLIETWGITHISDDFMVLYIELAYNTKEHHSYVANELKKVPGILKVDSYSEYGWNNSSYTNSFSGVSWAIESIQVEKVWEFTV